MREPENFDAMIQCLLVVEFPPSLPVRLRGVTASDFATASDNVEEQLNLV